MNLLPGDTKQALANMIRSRFLLTGSIVLTLAALLSMLALVPALLFAHAPQAALFAAESDETKVSEGNQMKIDRESVQHTRALLTELSALGQLKRSLSDTIALVSTLRPSGVVLGTIVYSSGKVSTLTVSGSAPNRDVINAYRTSLSQSGRFDTVSVPVAALVGALEGRFTITLTGAF